MECSKNKAVIGIMGRFLFLIMVITLLSSCYGVNYEESSSDMLSDVEGQYYITVLGASADIERQFETIIFQNNINKISGYYVNENPSDKEIRDLNIDEMPIFIVFDTKSEVYRTNNLADVNTFLSAGEIKESQWDRNPG